MRQKLKNIEENNTAQPTETDGNENDEHSMNSLLWLKTAVVSQANIADVRKKLHATRRLRDEMVQKDNVELMQEFPFFFTHPTLVIVFPILSFLFGNSILNDYLLIKANNRLYFH